LERNGVIYVFQPDGSGPRKLVAVPRCLSGQACHPRGALTLEAAAWSPDRSHFAFSVGDDWSPGFQGNVYVVNADGSGLHVLRGCNCVEFAWSPDGTRLALVDAGAGRDLLRLGHGWLDTYGVDGGLEHSTEIPIWFSSPTWSPDGATISFSELHASADELYMVGADGSGLHRLDTLPPSDDGIVSWTPTGDALLFSDPLGWVYTVDPTAGRRRLVHFSGCSQSQCGGPVWSPNRTRILYSDKVGVWTANADGSHRTLVYQWPVGTIFGGKLFWSPDGHWIVLTIWSWSVRQVVMRSDGRGLTEVAGGGSLIAG
jgi:Tol biopolymer transport system component